MNLSIEIVPFTEIFVSILCCATIVALHILAMKALRLPPQMGWPAAILSFVVGVLLYFFLVLGWFSADEVSAVKITTGLLIIFTFLVFYTEAFFLLNRGFSIGILVEIYKRGGSIDLQDVASMYSGGKGMEWMVRKRVAGLEALKLVTVSNEEILRVKFWGAPAAFIGRLAIILMGIKP